MWFDTHFKFSDGDFVSHIELRFWTQEQVNALVKKAGLSVTGFYGDWQREPFDEAVSKEMVFDLKIGEIRSSS